MNESTARDPKHDKSMAEQSTTRNKKANLSQTQEKPLLSPQQQSTNKLKIAQTLRKKQEQRRLYLEMKKQEELHKAQINELTEKRKRLFKKETSFDLFVKEAEELEVPIDGEVRKGSQIFLLSCMSCHGLTKLTHKNSEAPSLGLLYGRKAGSDSSFKNYSNAMVNANFNWTSRMLYLFMENPSKLIKGTNCGLVLNPIASQSQRADLLALFREFSKELDLNMKIEQVKKNGVDAFHTNVHLQVELQKSQQISHMINLAQNEREKIFHKRT